VPSLVLGLLLNDLMKRYLFSPWVVAVALVVGGVAILVIERLAHRPRYHDTAEVPPATAFGIGLCQTISMIPGVSRVGATIMGGLLLGLDRKAAAEFSFFLAIPTMVGASALDLYKGWGQIDGSLGLEIAVASLAAFVTAIIVVRAFVAYIARHDFTPFGWYRIAAGIVMLGLLAAGAA
jgi:undecaprenyl-diphosphatase